MPDLNRLLYELQTGDSELLFVAIGALLLVILVWGDAEKFASKAIAFSILAVASTVGALYFVADFLS